MQSNLLSLLWCIPVFICFVEGVNASDLDSLKLSSERTALKLDELLLKNGKAREAPDLNRTCLVSSEAKCATLIRIPGTDPFIFGLAVRASTFV